MSHGTDFNPDYKLPVMPPAKTKEEKNAERLQILATNKPYMHKRPNGMSMDDYRHERRAQNKEYKERQAPKYFWISQDSYATLMKGLSTGLAVGTYRKNKAASE